MVSRRRNRTPVLILDLDGTVLAENSFPRWALCLARGHFPHLGAFARRRISCLALAMLMARKLRLIGHETLKWRLQRLWQTATAGDGGAAERRLVSELASIVRPEMAPLLTAVATHRIDAVLATAAPGDYAYRLGRDLGFTDVLATRPERSASELGNSGEQKREAVMDFISSRGWQNRQRILFTDHKDDFPLMRVCQTIYWFGPEISRDDIERTTPGIKFHDGFRDRFPIKKLSL
jgi:phosphoserine phosphatase